MYGSLYDLCLLSILLIDRRNIEFGFRRFQWSNMQCFLRTIYQYNNCSTDIIWIFALSTTICKFLKNSFYEIQNFLIDSETIFSVHSRCKESGVLLLLLSYHIDVSLLVIWSNWCIHWRESYHCLRSFLNSN